MKEITTVTGTISPEELGFCQCHEHIAMSRGKSYEINPVLCIDDMQKSFEELKRYRACGGDSIIDAQPCGCNRMTKELYELSRKSGIHIIASTGFHKLEFYPENHWIHRISPEKFESILINELTTGMFTDADTKEPEMQCKARAGIIKTAYDRDGYSGRYRDLFQAAAAASIKTDRVIMVHVENNTNPVLLQNELKKQGVQTKNMMFCHMDRACKDIEIHKHILKEGSYLEYDTIGRFKYHSDDYEAVLFREMVASGYEEQLLFSLDTTRTRLKAYVPEAIGLDYILNVFNKRLAEVGITTEVIEKISIFNPVRIFTQ